VRYSLLAVFGARQWIMESIDDFRSCSRRQVSIRDGQSCEALAIDTADRETAVERSYGGIEQVDADRRVSNGAPLSGCSSRGSAT
jgi:hypothetical protein